MDPAPLLRSLVTRGDVSQVPGHVSAWLEQCVATCGPRDVHIMTGSGEEAAQLKRMLVRQHVMIPLPKYDNCFLVRWDNDNDNDNINDNDNAEMQDGPPRRGEVRGPHLPVHGGAAGLRAHARGGEGAAGQLDAPRPAPGQ